MKIVFLTTRFWPAIGGVEKYILELGRSLVGMSHDVTVVTGAHEPGLATRERVDGMTIHRFPAYRSRLRCWYHLARLRDVFGSADVIHISDVLMVEYFYALVGWMIRRKPVFMTRHGLSYRCPVPDTERRRAIRAVKLVDGVVDDGFFIAKWLQVPGDVVISQGLQPTAAEVVQTAESRSCRAVFVGRLEEDTCLAHYIDAIGILNRERNIPIELDVYGSGGQEADLRERVRRDRLPVTFHGWTADAQERLSDGRYAFVSGRLAMQEAMARKRLVVATFSNALRRDYVTQEPFSPYLEVGASGAEIAAIIERYEADDEARRELVSRAYGHACTLNWDATAGEYIRLWATAGMRNATATSWWDRFSLARRLNFGAAV
jgi:glycosyltransferase involved in cell wall biosynthesis